MDTTERRATGTPIREVLGFEERLTAIEKELELVNKKLEVLAVAQATSSSNITGLCDVLDIMNAWMSEMEAKR